MPGDDPPPTIEQLDRWARDRMATTDSDYISRMIGAMTPDDVRDWLQERLDNSLRISKTKMGEDRRGWLDDAAFFTAAIGLIEGRRGVPS